MHSTTLCLQATCPLSKQQNEVHVLVHSKNTKQQKCQTIKAYTKTGHNNQPLLTTVPTFRQTSVQNTMQMQNKKNKKKTIS
jgi:hypothetical protein